MNRYSKCDCSREWCEYFDALEGISYSKKNLKDLRDELKEEIDEIDKILPPKKGKS